LGDDYLNDDGDGNLGLMLVAVMLIKMVVLRMVRHGSKLLCITEVAEVTVELRNGPTYEDWLNMQMLPLRLKMQRLMV